MSAVAESKFENVLYEKKNNIRLLDLLDVHYYPQAEGVGIGTSGQTDPKTSTLRIRSTRSLYDPSYTDESWINDRMRVIPGANGWPIPIRRRPTTGRTSERATSSKAGNPCRRPRTRCSPPHGRPPHRGASGASS